MTDPTHLLDQFYDDTYHEPTTEAEAAWEKIQQREDTLKVFPPGALLVLEVGFLLGFNTATAQQEVPF